MSYIDDMQTRASRRKSPWNLLLFPLVVLPYSFLWYKSASVLGELYRDRHPEAEFNLLPNSAAGLGMGAGPAIVWLAPSMILANLLIRMIPPARRVLAKEAKPHPGTSFSEANKALFKVALFMIPVGLIAAIAGFVL